MRDLLIGTITGISAVIATALFTPKPAPIPQPIAIREVLATDEPFGPIPTTQPDPARQKLEKILARVEVKNGRLDKLLAYIAQSTSVNMAVNWRALEAGGIAGDCPITLNLHELPARVILKQTLAEAGGGNIKLAYRINNGIVTVSTADDLSRDVVTRVYDISDIVQDSIELTRNRAKDGGLFTNQQEATDELVKLIQEATAPTAWDANRSGGIRVIAQKAVVTETVEAQELVQQLLARLRHPQK